MTAPSRLGGRTVAARPPHRRGLRGRPVTAGRLASSSTVISPLLTFWRRPGREIIAAPPRTTAARTANQPRGRRMKSGGWRASGWWAGGWWADGWWATRRPGGRRRARQA